MCIIITTLTLHPTTLAGDSPAFTSSRFQSDLVQLVLRPSGSLGGIDGDRQPKTAGERGILFLTYPHIDPAVKMGNSVIP